MIRRGDVVIVDFPCTDVARSKVRPGVVIQNDRDNQRFRKTVVASSVPLQSLDACLKAALELP